MAISDLLEINTLGQFTIKYGPEVISEKIGRSKVLWELLKYLLTNRGNRLQADIVLETLWPDKEYTDTKTAFKAQVHRLKRMLSENNLHEKDHISIVYTQGCYRLDLGDRCRLDVDVMGSLFAEAGDLDSNDSQRAMDLYRQLIPLYRGDYLPEISSPWVFSARNHYRRMFMKSVQNLKALYREAGMHTESVRLYEDALQVIPFEEDLHICYLQALIDAGMNREARSYYENVTSREYQEIGAKPSAEMKEIYQLITNKQVKVDLDLSNIHEMMADQGLPDEAFVCQPDYFRFLYSLEKRRLERKGRVAFLGLLTITRRNYRPLPSEVLEIALVKLKKIISTNIRKGDVCTQWNEAQFLLLLPDLTREIGERVLKRIRSQFKKETAPEDLVLRYKVKPLL